MPTINYIYHGNQYLCETDENDTPTKLYVNEPGTYTNLVSQKNLSTGEKSYPLYDAVGSTRAVTDDNGDVTDSFVYDAWGNVLDRTGTTDIPFQYVGQHGYYRDEETKTNYVMSRTYEPVIMRWLSTGPLGFADSVNRYSFVSNSPLTFIDPTGLFRFNVHLDLTAEFARANPLSQPQTQSAKNTSCRCYSAVISPRTQNILAT